MPVLLKNDFQGGMGERIPHEWLNVIANFWNDFAVVGGLLQRRSDGRFTTISIDGASQETPDTAGYLAGTSAGGNLDAGRKTIERNPEAHHHNDELQLHDVDGIGTYRFAIPYFDSKAAGTAFNLVNGVAVNATPAEARAVGTLAWAVIDGHSNTDPLNTTIPVAESLHVLDGTLLQVGSFNIAGTCMVPFVACNDTPGDKWLNWRYPVQLNGTPYAQGLTGTAVLLGFGTYQGGGNYLQLTLPKVFAQVSGAALNLAEGGDQTLLVPYSIIGPIQGTLGTLGNHDDLGWAGQGTFAAQFGADCSDHDDRHFRRGSVGAVQNYCDAIGNVTTHGASAVIIDLDNYTLRSFDWSGGTSYPALNWQTMSLQGTWLTTGDHEIDGNALIGTFVKIDNYQVLGPRQTGVGTYVVFAGTTYGGIDNAQTGTPYASAGDLNDLEAKVEAISTYLASLGTALNAHGMIAP